MKLSTNQALSIPFYGDTLYLLDYKGQPYTPMKPIVEAMGLDWKSQYRRISSDPDRFSMVLMTIQLPGDIQKRKVLFIPVRKLFGWMMTVSPNRVRPAIRDKVIQYQNECDDILWEHWSKKNNLNNLIGGLEPQVADRIVSLNHLEAICEHRRSSAAILYFFLQNENSDLAEDRWFKMTCRELGQSIGFAFTGVGVALKYLYESDLIFKDTDLGIKNKYYYRINHVVLNRRLRQQHLPAINSASH